MGSPYTNTKRKSGKSSKFQKSFGRFIPLTALVISCAAIYQLIEYIRAEADNATEAEAWLE